jgi:hypothetical protein
MEVFMVQLAYLEPEMTVSFFLENAVPILKEAYDVPGAGKRLLRGFFNPKAHIDLLDGTRYRILSPRQDKRYLNQIAYPLVHWPDKLEVCRLLTPVISRRNKSTLPELLRFTTALDGEGYIFKRSKRLGRAFEIWDGMEMDRIVQRELVRKLVLDATVMASVPALLVLLLPWLDNQFLS